MKALILIGLSLLATIAYCMPQRHKRLILSGSTNELTAVGSVNASVNANQTASIDQAGNTDIAVEVRSLVLV